MPKQRRQNTEKLTAPVPLRALVLLLLCITLLFILYRAWVTEDAFITLRVIDNFFNGFGLRWNIDERVQVYTHPLWMFWLMPWYALTQEPFYTTIACAFVTSCGAVVLAVYSLLKAEKTAAHYLSCILFLLPLLLMPAFIEFSTSGLENPLSNLLIAWFCYRVFYPSAKHQPMLLLLIASLAVMNRLDHVLLFAPYLAYYFIRQVPVRQWWKGAVGALPILSWLSFSFIYYGFVLPNTYYAKLGSGMSASEYWMHGVQYFSDLVMRQGSGALVLLAVALVVMFIVTFRRQDKKAHGVLALLAGVLLFCLYVMAGGGDYMTGRFWVSPVFMASLVLAWWWPEMAGARIWLQTAIVAAVVISCALISGAKRQQVMGGWLFGVIAEERHYYRNTNLLFSPLPHTQHGWAQMGIELNRRIGLNVHTQLGVNVGMFAYYGGNFLRLIDFYALGDPFLARLPAKPHCRIGHFEREVPQGYFDARATGDYSKMEPAMREKALIIRSITQDPIFSLQRWQAMQRYYGW